MKTILNSEMSFGTLFIHMPLLLIAACSPPTTYVETDIEKDLRIGTKYQENQRLLSKKGWLEIYGDACDVGSSGDRDYVYVRGRDPSYTLTLTYDLGCKLEKTLIRKRNIKEL